MSTSINTQQQFFSSLKNQLSGLTDQEVTEILSDYKEHFSIALEHGKTEQKICQELGHPKQIARQYLTDNLITQAKNAKTVPKKAFHYLKAVMYTIILTPFNIIFVLTPSIIFSLILIALWAIPFQLFKIASSNIYFSAAQFFDVNFYSSLSYLFILIGTICFSIFIASLLYALSKSFLKMFLNYIEWNVHIITQKKGLLS